MPLKLGLAWQGSFKADLPKLLVDQLDSGVVEQDLVFLCMDGEVMASQARVATLSPLLYSLMQGQACCGCGGRKCSKRDLISLTVEVTRQVMVSLLWLCYTGTVSCKDKPEGDNIKEAMELLGININLEHIKDSPGQCVIQKMARCFPTGKRKAEEETGKTRKRARHSPSKLSTSDDPVVLQVEMAKRLTANIVQCNVPGCDEEVSLVNMTKHFTGHVARKESEARRKTNTKTIFKCANCSKLFKLRAARNHHVKLCSNKINGDNKDDTQISNTNNHMEIQKVEHPPVGTLACSSDSEDIEPDNEHKSAQENTGEETEKSKQVENTEAVEGLSGQQEEQQNSKLSEDGKFFICSVCTKKYLASGKGANMAKKCYKKHMKDHGIIIKDIDEKQDNYDQQSENNEADISPRKDSVEHTTSNQSQDGGYIECSESEVKDKKPKFSRVLNRMHVWNKDPKRLVCKKCNKSYLGSSYQLHIRKCGKSNFSADNKPSKTINLGLNKHKTMQMRKLVCPKCKNVWVVDKHYSIHLFNFNRHVKTCEVKNDEFISSDAKDDQQKNIEPEKQKKEVIKKDEKQPKKQHCLKKRCPKCKQLFIFNDSKDRKSYQHHRKSCGQKYNGGKAANTFQQKENTEVEFKLKELLKQQTSNQFKLKRCDVKVKNVALTKEPEPEYKRCPTCNKQYKMKGPGKTYYERHIAQNECNPMEKENIPGVISKEASKNMNESISPSKNFKSGCEFPHCSSTFSFFNDLRNHYTTKHYWERLEQEFSSWKESCYICLLQFPSRELLLRHVGNFHCTKSIDNYLKEDGFKGTCVEWTIKLLDTSCTICSTDHQSSAKLKAHLSNVHFSKHLRREFPVGKNKKCPKCRKICPIPSQRIMHIGSFHDEVMKYAKDFAKVGEDDANIIPVNGFKETGTYLDLSSLSEELLKSSLEVIQTDCSGSPSVSKKNRRSSLLPFQKAIKKEGEDHIMPNDHNEIHEMKGELSVIDTREIINQLIDKAVDLSTKQKTCFLCEENLTDHSDNQVLEHLTNHYQPELDEKYISDTESKPETVFQCPECGKMVSDKLDFLDHMGVAHRAVEELVPFQYRSALFDKQKSAYSHYCPVAGCTRSMGTRELILVHLLMGHFQSRITQQFEKDFSPTDCVCPICKSRLPSSWSQFMKHIAVTHEVVLKFVDEENYHQTIKDSSSSKMDEDGGIENKSDKCEINEEKEESKDEDEVDSFITNVTELLDSNGVVDKNIRAVFDSDSESETE